MFPTFRVDRGAAEAMEWLGTKRKFWFSREGCKWLFKAEERGTGDDWAEKIACELAAKLGIPHVSYELAEEFEGDAYLQPGVICPDFAAAPQTLILGNQLLWSRDTSYPKDERQKYGVSEHTLEAVARSVGQLGLPAAQWIEHLPDGITTASQTFTGYLLLDTLIANQDRHHHNWGAIQVPEQNVLRLAPSFDHGASLARNITDEERVDRLRSKDERRRIPYFCQRARSSFYLNITDKHPVSVLDAFTDFARREPDGARIWLSALRRMTREEICAIINAIPSERMSPLAKEFTTEMILVNKERLLK